METFECSFRCQLCDTITGGWTAIQLDRHTIYSTRFNPKIFKLNFPVFFLLSSIDESRLRMIGEFSFPTRKKIFKFYFLIHIFIYAIQLSVTNVRTLPTVATIRPNVLQSKKNRKKTQNSFISISHHEYEGPCLQIHIPTPRHLPLFYIDEHTISTSVSSPTIM